MRGGGSHVPALRRVVNTEGREVIRDNTSLGKISETRTSTPLLRRRSRRGGHVEEMSGTNDITNRLTAFVHVISCTCGGPVNTSVPVSDHERLLLIIRSLSQCKSVCSWNTGENQTAYSTGSGKNMCSSNSYG